MKIKVITKLRQNPQIEIDGKNIIGMDLNERLNNLHKITEKITDLPKWFELFLFAVCLEFGEDCSSNEIDTDIFELEL